TRPSGRTSPCTAHRHGLHQAWGSRTGPPQRGQVGAVLITPDSSAPAAGRQVPGPAVGRISSIHSITSVPRRLHTEPVTTRRVPCVGAVIKDAAGRLLLVKRGHEPGAGLWTLPGGPIEPGGTGPPAV